MRSYLLLCLFSSSTLYLQAQTEIDTTAEKQIPSVVIIAQKNTLLSDVCGAATYLNTKQLERISPLNGNEVLRQIPGLHTVDEEGMGLRANIGIRGLDPDRGASVLVLEDGVPIQLNPYGEPELYYTPVMDRMSGIEVVKGSGQIKYGPRTIAGVINYLSKEVPAQKETSLQLGGGSGGYFLGRIAHGNRIGKAGYVLDYLHKRADQIGVVGFQIHDAMFKSQLQTSEKSSLLFKAQFYSERSNSTYIGITQPMFDQGVHYPILGPDDHLSVQRLSLSLAHRVQIRPNLKWVNQAYYYQTTRDWRRQDFSYSATTSNQSGQVFGDTTIANGAIYLLKSATLRNRAFEVTGLESRMTYSYQLGKIKSQLESGVRFISEQAIEVQFNTTKSDSRAGQLATNEERPGQAWSAFVQQSSKLGSFDLTAGIRAEHYTFERNTLWAKNSVNVSVDTLIQAKTTTKALIPGIGLTYGPDARWRIFAGVHKGFAPPAIKQAINTSGTITTLGAQTSTNSELGFRAQPLQGMQVEITGFHLNFSNQVIPVSESSGQAGAGFINAGATLHRGVEAAFALEWNNIAGSDHAFGLRSSLTWTKATFHSDRFVGTDKINVKGNRLPYAPQWLTSHSLYYSAPFGLSTQFTLNTTGRQYADVLNTETASANGRNGLIPAFQTIDGQLTLPVKRWKSSFSLVCKNLTDERFIASRRPQGIKVGIPRMVLASWRFDL